MSGGGAAFPSLLQSSNHEASDELDLSLRDSFSLLRPFLRPPFSLKFPASAADYRRLTLALLYGVLSEPPTTPRSAHLVHLHAIVNDEYSLFTRTLIILSLDSFPRLLPPVKSRLLSAVSELVSASAAGIDRLIISLLRWIQIGDFSPANLWFAEQLLILFSLHWDILSLHPRILSFSLFHFLRLLSDHYRLSGYETLKNSEITFCVKILRQHFHICKAIGRDLVRLLQDLISIPAFRSFWEDLILRPETLGCPNFSDISQLYKKKTPPEYLQLGISPEMEKKTRFLLSKVKIGSRRRYLEWFSAKFLRRPEQEATAVDLIRFICCSHHPTNEILRSEIFPRWMAIGWLLTSIKKNYFAANAKLALFYDWIFFEEEEDNIMNIEPAILLMIHSVPEYLSLTQALMEFLISLVRHYDEDRKELVSRGVANALKAVVEKGVVRSLDELCNCAAISPDLRESFADLIRGPSS